MMKRTPFALEESALCHQRESNKLSATLHLLDRSVALSKCHIAAKKGGQRHITAGVGSRCIISDQTDHVAELQRGAKAAPCSNKRVARKFCHSLRALALPFALISVGFLRRFCHSEMIQ